MPTLILNRRDRINSDGMPPNTKGRPRRRNDGNPVLVMLPDALEAVAIDGQFRALARWESSIVIPWWVLWAMASSTAQMQQASHGSDQKGQEFSKTASGNFFDPKMAGQVPDNCIAVKLFKFSSESFEYRTPETAFVRMAKSDELPFFKPPVIGKSRLSMLDMERIAYQEIGVFIALFQKHLPQEKLLFLHDKPKPETSLVPERLNIDIMDYNEKLVVPLALKDFYKKVGVVPEAERPVFATRKRRNFTL